MGCNPYISSNSTLAVACEWHLSSVQFSSIAHLCLTLCNPTGTVARQPSLSITNSWSLLKLMSIESVMPSNHLTHCHTHGISGRMLMPLEGGWVDSTGHYFWGGSPRTLELSGGNQQVQTSLRVLVRYHSTENCWENRIKNKPSS